MRRMLIIAAVAAASCAPRARWGHTLREWDGLIADFERQESPFIGSSEKTGVECLAGKAIAGRCSLKVQLETGPYPGISVTVPKDDWRPFAALVFDVLNPSEEPFKLSVRIDDQLSMSWATRLNLENWITLPAGKTRCVLPLSGVELGSIGSRGLDLSKIDSLHLFVLGVKEPLTFYLDDVRLLRAPRREAPAALIPSEVSASEGASVTRGEGGSVRIAVEGGKYPGIGFAPAVADWLGHDILSLRVDSSHGRNLVIKIRGGNGGSVQCVTGVPEGASAVTLPLHVAGRLDLSRVAEAVIFTSPSPAGTISLSDARVGGLRVPPSGVTMPEALPEGTLLELDCSGMERVGRNTGMAFFVYPPQGRPIVATPKGKGDLRQVVKLDGLRLGGVKKLPAAAYFFDHGMAHFASGRLEVRPGGRTVWRPSAGDFGH